MRDIKGNISDVEVEIGGGIKRIQIKSLGLVGKERRDETTFRFVKILGFESLYMMTPLGYILLLIA